jgi:hypothetical protein
VTRTRAVAFVEACGPGDACTGAARSPGYALAATRSPFHKKNPNDFGWVRILCDGANLIDSSRLVAFALSGSIACG